MGQMQPAAANQATVAKITSSRRHRSPAIRASAESRERSVITGDQYWSCSETSNATCGCILVSRGNATHGPAVVGLPLDQGVREADGDAVLSTRKKVVQNLSPQKLQVLEEHGGKGENQHRRRRREERRSREKVRDAPLCLADTEPAFAPPHWSRSSGCTAESCRCHSGSPPGAEGPRTGFCHRVSASAEAGPDELRVKGSWKHQLRPPGAPDPLDQLTHLLSFMGLNLVLSDPRSWSPSSAATVIK